MTKVATDYEIFEKSSPNNRRLLRQEQLILEITEALSEALAEEGITKADLAGRLNKTKGLVSQVLSGGRNLTLRTIADFADALECVVKVQLTKKPHAGKSISKASTSSFDFEVWEGVVYESSFKVGKPRIPPVGAARGMLQGAA